MFFSGAFKDAVVYQQEFGCIPVAAYERHWNVFLFGEPLCMNRCIHSSFEGLAVQRHGGFLLSVSRG